MFKKVKSSNLDSVEYDAGKRILKVKFVKSSTIYCYQGVPLRTYTNLISASSVGSHFARWIKNKYKFTTE